MTSYPSTSPSASKHQETNGFQEATSPFRFSRGAPAVAQEFISSLRRKHAEGKMPETEMLDMLAKHLDLRRVDLHQSPPDVDVQPLIDPQFCLRNQLLPWAKEGDSLVLAMARPEDLKRVEARLALSCDGLARISPSPVIATSEEIQESVARLHRPELIASMASRVPADESCRTWSATSVRLQATLLTVLVVIGLFALFPKVMFGLAIFWAIVTLITASTLKLGSALMDLLRSRSKTGPPTRALAGLPKVSILVPLFRERCIAEALLARLEALEYPRDRLEVLLVLEEKDEVTRDTLDDLTLPAWMRVVLVPDGKPRTKPRAMNYALDFCRGEIIGIYDAEDWPDPTQLLRMAERFAASPADVACLQGALDYYNPCQTWLARCFIVEYNTWFRLILPGMTKLGFAVPLGGTTLFVKRDVLERLGGWDAHNVTEDADLGFRLARHGYRTEILDSTTGEEANCHFMPWIKQRSRWLKGYIVTYLVNLRHPVRLMSQLGPWKYIGFHMHFISAISQFMLAPLMWSFVLILLGMPHPLDGIMTRPVLMSCSVLFIFAELVNILLGMVGAIRGNHRYLLPWLPTMIFYHPLGCLAMYKAMYELIICPFYWDKTQHGHSLQNVTAPASRRT